MFTPRPACAPRAIACMIVIGIVTRNGIFAKPRMHQGLFAAVQPPLYIGAISFMNVFEHARPPDRSRAPIDHSSFALEPILVVAFSPPRSLPLAPYLPSSAPHTTNISAGLPSRTTTCGTRPWSASMLLP